MPITGVLNADFTPFAAAVDGAVLKLRDIETGSSRVESGLNRVGNSFSGARTIQEATLMAQVFDRAGGAAAFTEKELARMAATGAEAAAKLRALGQDVPPGIQRIADETRKADAAQKGLGETVKDVALGFAALLTARAAFDFVKDIVNDASALKDLSQQTHIGVEDLQILQGAMSEFGVEGDTLGRGLYKLSRGIAGGDESVATGLHLMGLSLKDVEGLQGQELFLKIERGLATLQGGLRDTAAAELYGGKLGAAMAGAAEGVGAAVQKWRELNHVAGEDAIDALDTFGESIARADKDLHAMATTMLGPMAQGFNYLYEATDRGASKLSIFWAMTKDSLDTAAGRPALNLLKLLDDINIKTEEGIAKKKAEAAALGTVQAAVDTRTAAERFLAALQADAALALTSTQRANLEQLTAIGALNAKNAAGIGVSVTQFAAYNAEVAKLKKTTEDQARIDEQNWKIQAKSITETTALWETYAARRTALSGSSYDDQRARIEATFATEVARLNDSDANWQQHYEALKAIAQQSMDAVGSTWDTVKNRSVSALEETAQHAADTYDQMVSSGAFFREELDKQLDLVHRLDAAARGWGDNFIDAGRRGAGGAHDFREAWERGFTEVDAGCITWRTAMSEASAAIDGNLQSNIKNVQTLAGEFITAAEAKKRFDSGGSADVTSQNFRSVVDSLNTTGGLRPGGGGFNVEGAENLAHLGYSMAEILRILSGPPGGTIPPPQGPRIPGFASGVENFGGGLAVVGERGPELVTLPAGSSVRPFGSSAAGGVTVHNTIYVNGTAADVARQVADEIMRTAKLGRKFGSAS